MATNKLYSMCMFFFYNMPTPEPKVLFHMTYPSKSLIDTLDLTRINAFVKSFFDIDLTSAACIFSIVLMSRERIGPIDASAQSVFISAPEYPSVKFAISCISSVVNECFSFNINPYTN